MEGHGRIGGQGIRPVSPGGRDANRSWSIGMIIQSLRLKKRARQNHAHRDLGYALFFAEPVHEETFKLHTYFLRAGEKEGEIDVVFEHGGQSYRVERDLGQSKRRSKV